MRAVHCCRAAPGPAAQRRSCARDGRAARRSRSGVAGRAGSRGWERCAPLRYSAPCGSAAWRSPLASERQVPTFHTGASRWSHAVFMPVAARTVSRRPPNFVPGQRLEPGFGDILTLSTLHQRFTRVRLTSSHLTGNPRLFHNAHHPGHWAKAACGGLDPGPATRVRGAFPHLLCSKVLKGSTATSSEPPLRAVVAHSRPHIAQ